MTAAGSPPSRWQPTAALYRAVSFAALALGAGIVLGRPDVAVLGIPIALSLVLALSIGRPAGSVVPTATATIDGPVLGDRPVAVAIGVEQVDGVQLVSVRTPDAAGNAGGGITTLAGGYDAEARIFTKAAPWGDMLLARPDLLAAGPDALFLTGPVPGLELRIAVPPVVEKVDGFELPPILGGWAGEHRSRRPGQGGDLVDLREFAPGDRLRSIHWRAYARHQKLFVRRTQSDADTEFVLCLDTRHEIVPKSRPPASDWASYRLTTARRLARLQRFCSGLVRIARPHDGPDPTRPRSSIDLTVTAATAVTAAQVKAGDRVGVLDLSNIRRHVRMGSGARHLQRVRHQLAQISATRLRWMPKPELWGLSPSAVVVLFSPLIDDLALQAGLDVAGRGHQVVVVDVLPSTQLLSTARADRHPYAIKEMQLLLAEREVRLDALRAKGIPVLGWDGGHIGTDLSALMRLRRHRR
jgi:uncharacterized protein (DUF58 family)